MAQMDCAETLEEVTMLEAIVIGFLATAFIGAGTSGTFGPNDREPESTSVAVVSERTGEVLYYTTK